MKANYWTGFPGGRVFAFRYHVNYTLNGVPARPLSWSALGVKTKVRFTVTFLSNLAKSLICISKILKPLSPISLGGFLFLLCHTFVKKSYFYSLYTHKMNFLFYRRNPRHPRVRCSCQFSLRPGHSGYSTYAWQF